MSDQADAPADQTPLAAVVEAAAARRDITPPAGIYARNWGAARHDVADGIHRPLTATVLALRSSRNSPPLILAVIDATWWRTPEEERFVRAGIIDQLGLDRARVLVSCTHTHAGPSLSAADADKPGGHLIGPYLELVRGALVDAARAALERAAPATLTWAAGRCDLATNRDLPAGAERRVLCGYNPARAADDTLLVGRVTDAGTGTTLATLVNYACHPTTLAWDNRLISPDFVGAMRDLVERHTGAAPCLFLQGASGELAPREQYVAAAAIADANGRRLGYAALAVLEGMLPPRQALQYAGAVQSGAPLATWRRAPFEPSGIVAAEVFDVELPLKPLPAAAEIQAQLDACPDRVTAERLRRKLRVVRSVGSGPTCLMPAWIWRIGRSLLVGHPNEAYSQLQIDLRRRFPDHAVVVMNLVNGACGYLASPELHDLDIYQVWQSPFGRDALPALQATCARQIEAMLH